MENLLKPWCSTVPRVHVGKPREPGKGAVGNLGKVAVLEICEFLVHLTKDIPQLAHNPGRRKQNHHCLQVSKGTNKGITRNGTFRRESQKQGKYGEDVRTVSITLPKFLSDKNTRTAWGLKRSS